MPVTKRKNPIADAVRGTTPAQAPNTYDAEIEQILRKVSGIEAQPAKSLPFRVIDFLSGGLTDPDTWIGATENDAVKQDLLSRLSGLLNPPALKGGAMAAMKAAAPIVGASRLPRIANPIRAYHGTTDRALKIPDPRKAVEVPGAAFFNDNVDVAAQYQYPREYGEIVAGPRGRIIEANLHVKNPMTVDFNGAPGEAARLTQLVKDAKAAGHDALIVKNVDDSVDSSKLMGTTIAVFDKSAIEFVKKYGLAAAVGAGLINEGQARQLQAQGYE
jgi:hypothetical protein